MRKTFFFDYVYYRIFHFFNYQSEDDSNRSFRAIGVISLMQSLYPFNILIFIRDIWFSEYHLNHGVTGSVGVFIIIMLMVYNYKKYDGRIEEFVQTWDHEDEGQRFVKGFLVLVFIILPFVPLLFLNWRK